jgi:hypothetical protein
MTSRSRRRFLKTAAALGATAIAARDPRAVFARPARQGRLPVAVASANGLKSVGAGRTDGARGPRSPRRRDRRRQSGGGGSCRHLGGLRRTAQRARRRRTRLLLHARSDGAAVVAWRACATSSTRVAWPASSPFAPITCSWWVRAPCASRARTVSRRRTCSRTKRGACGWTGRRGSATTTTGSVRRSTRRSYAPEVSLRSGGGTIGARSSIVTAIACTARSTATS